MALNGAAADELPFTYEEFTSWYEHIRKRRLEPACKTIERVLGEHMDDNLVEFDRARIRKPVSRVKTAPRVWVKLHKKDYRKHIAKLDDIPTVLDDLVGIRIVCNNTSDIHLVKNMLVDLPYSSENPEVTLSVHSGSEQLYLDPPKESGYRAFHVNLQTPVHGTKKWHYVTAELQVRTLLQDGWGELTHEDTYKTALKLPPLAQVLAKRMANLLSCVDEIAQDLRNELDTLARHPEEPRTPSDVVFEAGLADTPIAEPTVGAEPTDEIERIPEKALIQETQKLVSDITEPTSLASIAHTLQALFGQSLAKESWGRFGSFKAFLNEAAPEANIINIGPGMLIPQGADPSTFDLPDEDAKIPRAVRTLRGFDRHAPAVEAETLACLLTGVDVSLRADTWDSASIPGEKLNLRDINRLSKHTRDLLHHQGTDINRAKLGYLLTALLFTGNLRPGLPTLDAERIILQYLKARIAKNSITVNEEELTELDEWFEKGVTLRTAS
jgi:ppGpp synthetase/RelA/SpoT-type nucleotidyltranferase